ncbi:FAD-dependent oxidoreductase [Burkholderia pseudomallei]|nr:FAD-dependent oxidoreductase [Burkholderia pseudomallei]
MGNDQTKLEVDLVVVGAGAAGMTAALVAAIEGASVLLCESSEQVGGTAATSAGTVWVPGNAVSREAGYSDSVEAARNYLQALIGNNGRSGLRDAYLESAPAAVEYLARHSQVHFTACGMHPDYRDLPGAAESGRAMAPKWFDARRLGTKEFRRVRPPIQEFLVMGGMMAGKDDIPRLVGRFRSLGNFAYSGMLFLRYLGDRLLGYPRGTRLVMGNALVARLYASLLQRRVSVKFGARARELLWEDGRVAGVTMQTSTHMLRVHARKGVILAAGGYAHDAELRKQLMPTPTPQHSLACSTNVGDGIRLACEAGGRIANGASSSGAFWTPASVTRHVGRQNSGLFPHLSLDRAKPGLIAVNSAGRRFVNEADSYHDFVLAMFASHAKVPTIPAYLVCETSFVRKYGLGLIYPGTSDLRQHEHDGYIVCAATLGELADKLGIDAMGLIDTVEKYNAFAENGEDPDFGKGSTALNRFNGDSAQRPNPCLAPIARGPFCAMAVWPAEIACSSGIVTDENAHVLDGDGEPVSGLYACGNDMASIMDGTYPGPGTTLGPALTFAFRAVMHALKADANAVRHCTSSVGTDSHTAPAEPSAASSRTLPKTSMSADAHLTATPPLSS